MFCRDICRSAERRKVTRRNEVTATEGSHSCIEQRPTFVFSHSGHEFSLCTSTQPPTHPDDACVRRVYELFRRILRRYDRAGCRIKSILNVLLELPAVTTKRFFRRENLQHGAAASRAVCCCCCWNSANDADVCLCAS